MNIEKLVGFYVKLILAGRKVIEDVPVELRDDVIVALGELEVGE